MTPKINITETKELLEFLLALGAVLAESLKDDGRIGVPETLKLGLLLPAAGRAFCGIKDIPEEIKAIDARGVALLSGMIASQMPHLKSDEIQRRVTACLAFLPQLVAFAQDIATPGLSPSQLGARAAEPVTGEEGGAQ